MTMELGANAFSNMTEQEMVTAKAHFLWNIRQLKNSAVLLKKNAETLHQATVETAKEAERGIVDLETLQHTNEELIATLDEVLNIQKEGHEKRLAAEQELARIENQLNDKLLEVNYQSDVTRR